MDQKRGEIFLPTLPHWDFGNNWSGSFGRMRFFVTVSDGEGGRTLLAELWTRDVCRELADVEDSRLFPCTQEGLDGLRAWLEEQGERLGGGE